MLLGGGAAQARPSGKGGERWESYRQEVEEELLELRLACSRRCGFHLSVRAALAPRTLFSPWFREARRKAYSDCEC